MVCGIVFVTTDTATALSRLLEEKSKTLPEITVNSSSIFLFSLNILK